MRFTLVSFTNLDPVGKNIELRAYSDACNSKVVVADCSYPACVINFYSAFYYLLYFIFLLLILLFLLPAVLSAVLLFVLCLSVTYRLRQATTRHTTYVKSDACDLLTSKFVDISHASNL